MIEEKDLDELRHAIFTGLTVGAGSLVLHFSTGAQILVQCTFEIRRSGEVQYGHGEHMDSSPQLFGLINRKVSAASFDSSSTLSLGFDGGEALSIIPEQNGFESFVLTTKHGICPVTVF